MKKSIGYRIVLTFVFTLCLSLGVFLGFKYTQKNVERKGGTEIKSEDKEDEKKEKTAAVSTKTYDVEVVYKDEYTTCGHVIESSNIVYSTTLEKLKSDEEKKQRLNSEVYNISDESNEKIVYSRIINQNCPNHFLVKAEDNDIIIYNIIDEGTKSIYKKLDEDLQTLNPEMLEELNNGIRADSKEELNLIIEDIES